MILIIDTDRADEQGFMLMKHQCTADGCARVKADWSELPEAWISVKDRLPENFVSVIGHMTDAGVFPAERECYCVGKVFYFPALSEFHPVSHWMEFPEPPKEDE